MMMEVEFWRDLWVVVLVVCSEEEVVGCMDWSLIRLLGLTNNWKLLGRNYGELGLNPVKSEERCLLKLGDLNAAS